jgi:hypothetical protein
MNQGAANVLKLKQRTMRTYYLNRNGQVSQNRSIVGEADPQTHHNVYATCRAYDTAGALLKFLASYRDRDMQRYGMRPLARPHLGK